MGAKADRIAKMRSTFPKAYSRASAFNSALQRHTSRSPVQRAVAANLGNKYVSTRLSRGQAKTILRGVRKIKGSKIYRGTLQTGLQHALATKAITRTQAKIVLGGTFHIGARGRHRDFRRRDSHGRFA